MVDTQPRLGTPSLSPAEASIRRPRLASAAAAVLIAAHALLVWLARGPGIETLRDDAKYLLLGRALRHFSYREFWRPGAPIHAQYPPGYPLFLALSGPLAGDRYDWFIALNVAMSVVMLWLLYRTIERRWSWQPAILVLLILVPNDFLIERAGQLVSEPLFTLLGVAAVSLLASSDPSSRRLFWAGTLATVAALTRSVGVALVAAIVLLWVLERRWRAAAILGGISLVTVGSWLAWTVHAAPSALGESYVGDAVTTAAGPGRGYLVTMGARVAQHAADFLAVHLPRVVTAPSVRGTLVDNVISSALLAIAALAGLLVFWKQWRAAALYVVLTLGLLLAWPFFLTRFAEPLAPLLAAAIIVGVNALVRPIRMRYAVMVVLSVTLATNGLMRSTRLVAQRKGCVRGSWPPAPSCTTPDKTSVFDAAMWIRAHLEPNEVVVYIKPETIAYYSGRQVYPAQLLDRRKRLSDQLHAIGARWVLLSSVVPVEPLLLRERLQADCGHLALAASFPPRAYLFRVAEGNPADSTACRALEEYRRTNMGHDFDQ